MMIKSLCFGVILGLVTFVNGELYALNKKGKRVQLKLSHHENISQRELLNSLKKAKLDALHLPKVKFDRAELREILSLPQEFYENHLVGSQLAEIILNNKTIKGGIFSKKISKTIKKFKKPQKAMEKLKVLHAKLSILTFESVGQSIDAVVEALPEKFYGYLSPMTVLAAPTTSPSLIGYAYLFHLPMRFLKKLDDDTRGSVISVFNALSDIENGPKRVFAVTDLLTKLMNDVPIIHEVIGDRILQLSSELVNFVDSIKKQAELAKKLLEKAVNAKNGKNNNSLLANSNSLKAKSQLQTLSPNGKEVTKSVTFGNPSTNSNLLPVLREHPRPSIINHSRKRAGRWVVGSEGTLTSAY